jgi:tetratricopeptide (TPR) repeat protein
MTMRFAIVLALFFSACARTSVSQFERDFEQARQTMWRGDFGEAQKLADAGERRASTHPDSPWRWRFRLLSAEISILRRDFSAAQPSITAQLPPQSEFDALRARQKFLEAKVEVANGRFQSAREALEQGRRMAPARSDVKLDIDQLDGQALLRLGAWNDADAVLNRVVSQAAADADEYHEALALNDLGMGRVVRNRYDAALPYFERVVSLAGLTGSSVFAVALNNAGTCYQRLGQFDRALAVQQRAFEVHERRGKREYFVQALGEMGMLYLLHGEPSKAQPFLKRAFDEATAAKLLPDAALWASNLASADMILGEWDEAERFNDEAMKLKASLGTGRVFLNALVSAGIA